MIVIYNCSGSALYYKHVTIVNYASSSLARVVNYDSNIDCHSKNDIYERNMLVAQATL
jgi:hypothetical protein